MSEQEPPLSAAEEARPKPTVTHASGNVLYDVASAAALAIMLNRSLIYGVTRADRKFGALLAWEVFPAMDEVDELRRRRCS